MISHEFISERWVLCCLEVFFDNFLNYDKTGEKILH